MASLSKHDPHIQAAQSKLAIAHFIDDRDMWSQAMASMKFIYEAAKHIEDRMFMGCIRLYSSLEIEDIECSMEMYGDLLSVDGDLLIAQYKINTEVSF